MAGTDETEAKVTLDSKQLMSVPGLKDPVGLVLGKSEFQPRTINPKVAHGAVTCLDTGTKLPGFLSSDTNKCN